MSKQMVFKKTPPGPSPEIQAALDGYIRTRIEAENLELETWAAESIALADFDRIDDIFIACLPDGTRAMQSWWNKPEWVD